MEIVHLLAVKISIPPDERHGSRVMLKSTIGWLIRRIFTANPFFPDSRCDSLCNVFPKNWNFISH